MKQAWMFVMLALAACATEEEAPIQDEELERLPDDMVVYDTVVTVNRDGSFAGEPRAITVGEQRAQIAARERGDEIASANPYDPGCGTSSLWLYWRTDWTGSRLCFRGCGNAMLADFTRFVTIGGVPTPVGNWEMYQGSHWAGADVGFLAAWDPGGPTYKSTSWGYYTGKQSFYFPIKSRGIGMGYTEIGVGCE